MIPQPWPHSGAARDAAAYALNETVMTAWLDSHAQMVDHWDDAHPNNENAPGPCCLPLVREEALRFARVERMYPDGLVTALEVWGNG